MSYNLFRNISGIDNLIDRGEYGTYFQATNPFGNPLTNSAIANYQFSLADRNMDNRLNYGEFLTRPRTGYYPGAYTFGY